jgi:NADPH2:quinone reductase
MRAIVINEWGGPEVLQLVDDQPEPEPGPGQQRIRVTAAGVNFADTHAREDAYIAKYELPLVPGTEVAGTLDDGTRVVAMPHHGGYAEYAVADEQSVFPLPDDLGDHEALALLIQGLTAWHLYRTAAQLRRDETVVVHSAAGGTGSLAVQLAKPMGAGRVIASAGSAEKRELVARLGADAVIDSVPENMTQRLLEANDGNAVDVVFDMAGGQVFEQSAEALAPFGRIVVYGIASREQNDLRTGRLMRKSRGVVGFWLMHCLERPETMMREPLRDLFERAARGEIKPQLGKVYPLSEVRQAHEDLAGRRTTGKLALDPRR